MRGFAIALALAPLPIAAHAEDRSVEAGTAIVNQPDHLGARSHRWFAVPTLSATFGDRLQASMDDGIRWTAFDLGALKAGPVAEYRASYDRGLPAGFPKIGDAIEPGLFAALTTPVAVIEGRIRRAITGYGGWSADLAADTELPIRIPGKIGLEGRAAWADRAFGRSRFAVNRVVAASNGIPAYAADHYLTVGAGARWRLPVLPRIALTTSVGIDRLLTNGASPLVDTRAIVEMGVGLTCRLGR